MTGKANSQIYRSLSLEDKSKVQYQKIIIDSLKKRTKILGLYILDDNRYIYHVLDKMTEKFYILNANHCRELVIKSKKNHVVREDVRKYTCSIGNCKTISFELMFDDEVPELSQMGINNRFIYNKFDIYLYDMFHDIYRMSVSK